MNKPNLEQLYAEIANGDQDAHDFIVAWQRHSHIVDDIIDEKITEPTYIIKAFVNAQGLLQLPFYKKCADSLWIQLLLAANAYIDSMEMADKIDFRKGLSDSLRSYPNEMLILVAMLTAKPDEPAFDRVRKISADLRILSYLEHHDTEGNPI